jgi:hypothetical protein
LKTVLYSLFLLAAGAYAQPDSVKYDAIAGSMDGVFLTYGDFRHNRSIKRDDILMEGDKTQLDYVGKSLSGEFFNYNFNGVQHKTVSRTVFGFVQNNTFYVNYRGDFYRIPVFGAICYFVANVTVVNNSFYDPRFGYPAASVTTTEIKEFIMDFYDGYVLPLSLDLAEEMLQRDVALFSEYKKVKRKRRKEELYRFIRMYNERHPVYFLKE